MHVGCRLGKRFSPCPRNNKNNNNNKKNNNNNSHYNNNNIRSTERNADVLFKACKDIALAVNIAKKKKKTTNKTKVSGSRKSSRHDGKQAYHGSYYFLPRSENPQIFVLFNNSKF